MFERNKKPEWLRLVLPFSYFDVRVDDHNGDPADVETRAWDILENFIVLHGLAAYGVDLNILETHKNATILPYTDRKLYELIDAGVRAPAAVRSPNFHMPSLLVKIPAEYSHEFSSHEPQLLVCEQLVFPQMENHATTTVMITNYDHNDRDQNPELLVDDPQLEYV